MYMNIIPVILVIGSTGLHVVDGACNYLTGGWCAWWDIHSGNVCSPNVISVCEAYCNSCSVSVSARKFTLAPTTQKHSRPTLAHTTTRAPLMTKVPDKTTKMMPQVLSTSPKVCRRDIFILIDRSWTVFCKWHTIKISEIISHFHIGPSGTRFAVALFDNKIYKLWDLSSYTTKASLQHAVQGIKVSPRLFVSGNNLLAVEMLNKYFLQPNKSSSGSGNDVNIMDSVIIITGSNEHPSRYLSEPRNVMLSALHLRCRHVITVGLDHVDHSKLTDIATDTHHALFYPSAATTFSIQSFKNAILKMICA